MTEALSIQAALANVMASLPAIGKDGKASPTQGGYAYRGIEQITREVQTLFAANGVVIAPKVRSIDVKDITVQNKPWTDTTLIVDYLIVGPDGSTIEATTVGIGRDNSDKGSNKAMTQAFKYLLLQLLCISDAKDDGDGHTFEADSRRDEPEHPLAGRVREVAADMKALDEAGKADLKLWASGHSLAGPALLADEPFLGHLEVWLDEYTAKQRTGDSS